MVCAALGAVFLAALATSAQEAEADPPEPQSPPREESRSDPDLKTSTTAPAESESAADPDFTPSEEVSPGGSISFPVDI